MLCRYSRGQIIMAALLLLAAASSPLLSAAKDEPAAKGRADLLRMGVSGSILRSVSDETAKEAKKALTSLIEARMGRPGEMIVEDDLEKLNAMLLEGKVELAVYVGYEFGWARQKHPKLQPLIIAASGDVHQHAFLMVRSDNKAENLAQLKGQALALPRETRSHCRLYLERQCQKLGKAPKDFFSEVTVPGSMEDALDDVVDGAVAATVVDGFSLASFKRRKPGRFAKLREVQKSEVFPSPVFAYQEGALTPATQKRYREDLLKSNDDPDSQRWLTLCRLSSLEAVPEDYERTLTEIVKVYPAPEKSR
jgi:ABC-type phosphate/phosphonate transport system substrate-binding protein